MCISEVSVLIESHQKEIKNYIARLYYHDELEYEFSGSVLDLVLSKLHLILQGVARSGWKGDIYSVEEERVIHSCVYQSNE